MVCVIYFFEVGFDLCELYALVQETYEAARSNLSHFCVCLRDLTFIAESVGRVCKTCWHRTI